MIQERIWVLVYAPGLPGAYQEIENNLDSYRFIVGGNIEGWSVPGLHSFALYCRDYGRYECPPNRPVPGLDTIHGPFIIFKVAPNGDEISMTKEEATKILIAIP